MPYRFLENCTRSQRRKKPLFADGFFFFFIHHLIQARCQLEAWFQRPALYFNLRCYACTCGCRLSSANRAAILLADVPRASTDQRRNHTVHSGKQDKLHKKTMDGRRATQTDEAPTAAIVAGILICVVALLLMLVIGLVLWRRRQAKRNRYHTSAPSAMEAPDQRNPGEAVALTVNYKNRPLPDIGNQKNGTTGKSPHLSTRSATSREDVCCATTPRSIQKQAWDQMLQKQDNQSDENNQQHDQLRNTSSITSLPPPPSFLLEGDNDDSSDDAASYQDIIDGYHSEDNLDDIESDKCNTATT